MRLKSPLRNADGAVDEEAAHNDEADLANTDPSLVQHQQKAESDAQDTQHQGELIAPGGGGVEVEQVLYDGGPTIVMHKHDRLKVGEVRILWIGDDQGFVLVEADSPSSCR